MFFRRAGGQRGLTLEIYISGNIYLEPSLHLPLHPAVSIPPSDTVASIPPSGTLVDAMVEKLPPPVRPV